MLGVITESLVELQESGGFRWKFNGQDEFVLKLPVLLWLGDAVGNDKLCALRGGADNPQCRYCRCPYGEMGNPDANYRLTKMSSLKRNCLTNPISVKKLGYYPLRNNAMHKIQFCHPVGGINQCTPAEMLHQIERGIMEYGHLGFFNLMCDDDSCQAVFSPRRIQISEKKMLHIGYCLRRQSDRNLPKTYFRSGYIPNKERGTNKRRGMKRSGQEMSGVMLVITLFLQSNNREIQPVLRRIGEEKLDGYVHIFSRMLLLIEFLKQCSIRREDVGRLHDFYRAFFDYYTTVLDRKEGAGANLRKFHYMVHTALDIVRFAVPNNYTGHVPEANFKHHKNDARRTQKRAHNIDFQQGTRYVEGLVLTRAHYEITERRNGGSGFFWGEPERPTMINKVGSDVINIKFHFYDDEVDGVVLSPTRFRADKLEQRWRGRMITLQELKTYLQNEVGPALDQIHSSVSVITEVQLDRIKYKAHPMLRSGEWHDWAYVRTDLWGTTPCHLLCFLKIQGLDKDCKVISCLTNNDEGNISDVVYALCHYLPEDPFSNSRHKVIYGNNQESYYINPGCPFVRWSCKVTSKIHEPTVPRRIPRPKIGLVSIDRITGPAIAIPDDDASFPHTWHVVAGRKEWPAIFSELLLDHVPNDQQAKTVIEMLKSDEQVPLDQLNE